MKILWLTPPDSYTEKLRKKLEIYLRACNISLGYVMYHNVHRKVTGIWHKKKEDSAKETVNLLRREEFDRELSRVINVLKPTIIVCNDPASLAFIADGLTSLDLARGSVYNYNSIPVLVVDDLLKTVTTAEGGWLLKNDLNKLRRWQSGNQKKEPKFVWDICFTIQQVRNMFETLNKAEVVAEDIETSRGFITCITFTGLWADGKMHTYLLPFFNNFKEGNAHWETEEEEIEVWNLLRVFHANEKITKVFQNGNYDCAYFVAGHCPPVNFTLDTMIMFNAIWCEAEKSLNKISASLLDYCRYWKEDLKASKDDTKAHKGSGLNFKSPDKLLQYWRYACLDTYNTLLNAIELAKLLTAKTNGWALSNYARTMSLQIGPAFRMSMTGMRMNIKRQQNIGKILLHEHRKSLEELRTIVGSPDYNVFSSDQNATLIYDILKTEPLKKKGRGKDLSRSTDEKVLKILIEQHPFVSAVVHKIWECKKPYNNWSKYVENLRLKNSRFLYSLGAAGTETGRFNSTNHAFYCGTQIQNVPVAMRHICVADEGYVFIEFDYAQSDAWFVAFESEDQKFMETMRSDKDTHCIHAAHFFKVAYELVYSEYKAKTEWAVHPLTGVRNITKRVVHGANFQMSDFTLYMTMGRQAVIGGAVALKAVLMQGRCKGLPMSLIHVPSLTTLPKDFVSTKPSILPYNWSQDVLVKFCGLLLEDYHSMYTNLRKWFNKSKDEAVRNGNKVTCAHGRTRLFFGDITNDKEIQRQLSAYYGQGGTAGNINRTLMELYYDPEKRIQKLGGHFISQTHDSLLFMVPIFQLERASELVISVMEKPFEIKGRKLSVPAEAKYGFSWGNGLLDFKKGADYVELMETAERKLDADIQKDLANAT